MYIKKWLLNLSKRIESHVGIGFVCRFPHKCACRKTYVLGQRSIVSQFCLNLDSVVHYLVQNRKHPGQFFGFQGLTEKVSSSNGFC
jgi:hypothetical protein